MIDSLVLKYSQRSEHFKEVRKNRLYEIAEDYTELIADLIHTHGQARVCDIAKQMGITHVSVLKTLKKLIRDGYLEKKSNGNLDLTPKGVEMAFLSKKKHQVLFKFLIWLGVPEHIAATDVEGMEHYVSPATLEAIEVHMNKLTDNENRQECHAKI